MKQSTIFWISDYFDSSDINSSYKDEMINYYFLNNEDVSYKYERELCGVLNNLFTLKEILPDTRY